MLMLSPIVTITYFLVFPEQLQLVSSWVGLLIR